MDPITAAIIAAVSAGVAAGAGTVAQQSVVDAYDALKALIKRKFGDDSKINQAIAQVEEEPDFKPNQDALAGRVEQAGADKDAELLAAARKLNELVQPLVPPGTTVQQATGSNIAQASGGSTASVNVNQPDKD